MTQVEKSYYIPILKRDEEKRLVVGVVLEPGVIDAHNDIVTEEEIEKAAHSFLMRSRVIGLQHSEKGPVDVVESYVAPVDMEVNGEMVRKGSWIMAVKVHGEAVWKDVKAGKYTGFSIGGFAERVR